MATRSPHGLRPGSSLADSDVAAGAGQTAEDGKPRRSYVRNVACAHAASQIKANSAAKAVLPMLDKLRSGVVTSLNALARQLNALECRGPRGGAWTATAVKRALARVR